MAVGLKMNCSTRSYGGRGSKKKINRTKIKIVTIFSRHYFKLFILKFKS